MDPKTLTVQYGYTTWLFGTTLKDLTDDQALNQPTPGGNCLNWVTGHIVQSRGGTLKVLGRDAPFPAEKYARYDRGSAPITGPEGTIPLSEMRADFAATQPGLVFHEGYHVGQLGILRRLAGEEGVVK